jgi:hypothetical protein
MKSKLAAMLVLGFLFFAYTSASAENISGADDIENLSGTRWKLSYTEPDKTKRDYDVEFKKGGIFWYNEARDVTPDNDFWEQNGKVVKISFNNGYSKYEGRIISKDLIQGAAINTANLRWEFELRRNAGASAPVEKISGADTKNLSGTKWKLTDDDGDYDVEFKKGGIFWYNEARDVTPDNDFWEQNGESVKISFNGGYAIYEGRFISNDLIKGTAVNIGKHSWDFELRRK